MNRLKTKSKFHVVPFQKQKKAFPIRTKNCSELKTSSAGNRTPLSNVTGCDTHHYATESTVERISSKFVSYEILKL